MYKSFLALIIVFVLSQPLFAQYFTGVIYGETVSIQLESVGKNAWQGYIVYDEECYSVALVRVDSQTLVSKVKHGFVGLVEVRYDLSAGVKTIPEPSYGFCIKGDPASDSIHLIEQEIVQFPRTQIPERTTVTLRKSDWRENEFLYKMGVYKKAFALSSNFITSFDSNRQIPCNLDPNLIGIWENVSEKMYLSVHSDGTMMTFRTDNKDRIREEKPENQASLSFTVWCTGAGTLYTNRVNDKAREFGHYYVEKDTLTLPAIRIEDKVFRRK